MYIPFQPTLSLFCHETTAVKQVPDAAQAALCCHCSYWHRWDVGRDHNTPPWAAPSRLKTSYCCLLELNALRQTSLSLQDVFTSKSYPQPEPCYPAKPCTEGPCSLGVLVPAQQALASLCRCFAECRILPLWGDVVLAESPRSLRDGHRVTWPGQVWLHPALRTAQPGCPSCLVGGTNPSQPLVGLRAPGGRCIIT